MSGHTPGPWVYEYTCIGHTVRQPGAMRAIAGINTSENPEQDAHLIAAAPELLSIAEQWAALDGGAWNVARHASEKAELLAETRAVIAKAKGQTP